MIHKTRGNQGLFVVREAKICLHEKATVVEHSRLSLELVVITGRSLSTTKIHSCYCTRIESYVRSRR